MDSAGAEKRASAKAGSPIYRFSSLSFLQLIHHAVEIGITAAKHPCEPVSAAFGNFLAIRDDIKLARIAGRNDSINAESLLDHGHETRDLGFVVSSSGAGTYLYFHLVLHL
jgi:hypothetical protein